jgi:hypothetical protein
VTKCTAAARDSSGHSPPRASATPMRVSHNSAGRSSIPAGSSGNGFSLSVGIVSSAHSAHA